MARVRATNLSKAYQMYNTELTEVVGASVINTSKADAVFFEVAGVPARMSDLELAQSLKLKRADGTIWTCHPETRLAWTGPGFKKMLVKAKCDPPRNCIKVQYVDKVIALLITP